MWYDAFVFSAYAFAHYSTVCGFYNLWRDKWHDTPVALGKVVLNFLLMAACYEGWQWMGWVN